MHKDFYREKKQEKLVDISASKLVVICITILAFFVIPAQVITYAQTNDNKVSNIPTMSVASDPIVNQVDNTNNDNSSGRVAGVSIIAGQSTGQLTQIPEQVQYFVYIGIFFSSLGAISILYLLLTGQDRKTDHYKYEYEKKILTR